MTRKIKTERRVMIIIANAAGSQFPIRLQFYDEVLFRNKIVLRLESQENVRG